MDSYVRTTSQTIRDHGLLQNRSRSKSLGQHFLTDPRILKRIVEAAGDLSGRTVLEIGPGPGGLTREILKRNPSRLVAIEKDPACVAALAALKVQSPALKLIEADATTFDYSHLPQENKIKIISNLPYNVGTLILLKLLEALPAFSYLESFTLMFQKEVAEHILAKCGTPAYGRLSVLVQYWMQGEKILTLAPGAFTPPPKVQSTVIRLTPKRGDLVLAQRLAKVTKVAFGERRKMLRKSLLRLWPKEKLSEIFSNLGIDAERRPETLSVDLFAKLAQFL